MSRAQDPQHSLTKLERDHPKCFEPLQEFRFKSHENRIKYTEWQIRVKFQKLARDYEQLLVNNRTLDMAKYEEWGFIYGSFNLGQIWKWTLIFELNLDKYTKSHAWITKVTL